MKQVSLRFIDAMLEPLVGLADDDEEVTKYAGVDSDSADEVKLIIRQVLKPHYEMFDQPSRQIAKDSLSYFLCHPDTDFERLYYSNLMPFDAPDPPRDFFVWLWEVLFEYQDYEENNLHEFQEQQSLYVPNRIKIVPQV